MSWWWELGESTGFQGVELSTHRITCAFCGTQGNFTKIHHVEKKGGAARRKTLNYEIIQCENCGNYTMVYWSGSQSSRMHDFRSMPWPLQTTKFPEHWPKDVGQYWMEAQRSLEGKNWNAAAVMARSAVQLTLRHHNAVGNNLKQEIDDLAKKGLLPPVMKEWSHEVRDLGNDSAHPTPGASIDESDAKDVVQFLSTLLTMLYDLPHQIKGYRARKKVVEQNGDD
jgi:hypothetical protein